MTPTPTFRVADGMLVENARMDSPVYEDYLEGARPDDTRMTNQRYNIAKLQYNAHLASLRSSPIAPGCVLEGESLREGVDFMVGCKCDVQNSNKNETTMCFFCSGTYVYPIKKELKIAVLGPGDPTPPARAFSLAEALEIWEAGWAKGLHGQGTDKESYFFQRFNVKLW